MKLFAAIVSALLLVPAFLFAEDCCDCKCDRCGCQSHCQKVGRVICEMKDVKVTCYCCREEDVNIPGHSEKCGEVCEPNPCCLAHPAECDACAAGGGCGNDGCGNCQHKHSFLDCLFGYDKSETRTVWQPGCSGRIRTVNKLIKYEVTKKVPTYKYVVENCCCQCGCQTVQTDVAPQQSSPAEPLKPAPGKITTTSATKIRPILVSEAPQQFDKTAATVQASDSINPTFVPHAELPAAEHFSPATLDRIPWERLEK